jgi:hypothetical protein
MVGYQGTGVTLVVRWGASAQTNLRTPGTVKPILAGRKTNGGTPMALQHIALLVLQYTRRGVY